jgi:6-phosphogluconolactonase
VLVQVNCSGEPQKGGCEPDRTASIVDHGRRQGLDVVGLMGIGPDGHTASLFPGSAALNEQQRWVATSYVERLHAHRLTLTLPVINHAAQISFLVSGASKAPIIEAILCAGNDLLPAARIQPADGQLTWFITQDATGALAKR